MQTKLLSAGLLMVLLSWPKTASGQCSTYGGQATVFQANGVGTVPVVLSDTGKVNSTGGVNDASLLNASVPGLLSGEVLSATAGAEGSFSQSVASLAYLNLSVAGNTIGANFVMARANAYCGSGSPTVSGSTEIDGLVVNGLNIVVTGALNQIVSLLGGGFMILNEQTSSVNGSMMVNAIHVSVPGITDAVVASAFASISGQLIGTSGGPLLSVALLLPDANSGKCGNGDFFTGGGWINTSSSASTTPAKKTFGVSGGFHRDGTPFGHLEYVDHGTTMVNVHGTGVTSCLVAFSNLGQTSTGIIQGTARVNGNPGCTYTVTVTDDDSPEGTDMFGITLADDGSGTCPFTGYSAGPAPLGGGGNGGGDIEFHPD